MSLISDPEYLIHHLRLTYLRHVDDPYGPRIITINPNYNSNPYIAVSGLADSEKWPELNIPPSPIQDEELDTSASKFAVSSKRDSHSVAGYPAATGLKYTQTIMGNRTGTMGMRVNGRRSSSNKEPPLPPLPVELQGRRIRSDSAPTPVLNSNNELEILDGNQKSEKRRSVGGVDSIKESPKADTNASPPSAGAIPTPVMPFNPPFARAAEMEVRRKARMRKRARLAKQKAGDLNEDSGAETSSSTENDLEPDSDFAEAVDDDDDTELGPPVIASSVEDEISAISTGSVSTTAEGVISGLTSTSMQSPRKRRAGRLSPVSEDVRNNRNNDLPKHDEFHDSSIDLNLSQPMTLDSPNNSLDDSKNGGSSRTFPPSLSFQRIVPAPPPQKSLLSTMLSSRSSQHDNPFSELYAAVAARQDAYTLSVFFPHSKTPFKPMEISVLKEATVEEVIGFALWNYWEKKWPPSLEDGLGENEERRKIQLSAVGWSLRIAEDDGEVDEDFPPLDRAKKISTFNFDAYAITLEASQSQIAKNVEYDAKLVRRPSRVRVQRGMNSSNMLAPPAPQTVDIASSALTGDFSMGQSLSLGPSPHQGPTLFLRIRIANQPNVVHISTTIPVSAGTYMAEALDSVCRKRKIDNPKEWALMLSDPRIPIPLDRTVASLQGKSDLLLIKRSEQPNMGFEKRAGRTTDPNASILKRMSEVPEEQNLDDFTAAYKKFNVIRKLPVLGHNDRTLAIDGDYIHIMPAGTKGGFLDSSKTASYHVKSVIQCGQSRESSAFKLIVRREGASKRYDFEAESAKQAEEIVHTIRSLQKVYKTERGGGSISRGKSRRNRQV